MEHRYNVEQFFKDFLAYRGIPYLGVALHNREHINVAERRNVTGESSYNSIDYKIESKPIAAQNNSTPLYKSHNGEIYYLPITLTCDGMELFLPYAVVSISQSKNIVTTQMQGLGGSVHELVSIGDTEVSIKGMVVSNNKLYPEREVRLLASIFKSQKPVEIISMATDIFAGIGTSMILSSMNLPETNIEDTQLIEINAISDMQFELEIK